jgi:hypothetical protein
LKVRIGCGLPGRHKGNGLFRSDVMVREGLVREGVGCGI